MTVEEKRTALKQYCRNRKCENCVLNKQKDGVYHDSFDTMHPWEVITAYEIIKNHEGIILSEPSEIESCAEIDGISILLSGSKVNKIDNLTIYFKEE